MGESQGGLSAEVDQSAAAGLLWLREGKGDHCGNVAGGPLEGFYTAQLKEVSLLLSTCHCFHVYSVTCLLDVVE